VAQAVQPESQYQDRSQSIAKLDLTGARVGDAIAVTGPLGGSILGKHLKFTPFPGEDAGPQPVCVAPLKNTVWVRWYRVPSVLGASSVQ
jgi:hypothetical protein